MKKLPKKRDKRTPKQRLDSFMRMMEDIGKQFREGQKMRQKELTVVGNKIRIERMMELIIDKKMPGECDNISEDELKKGKKREKVLAGQTMCSVGIIRRGRNWGDYGGVFCAECPYFIPNRPIEEC